MNEQHVGSDFDDFLREERLLEEAAHVLGKRLRIEMVDANACGSRGHDA